MSHHPDWAIGSGEPLTLGTAFLGRGEIIAFAREFDGQPFHLDEAAAETTLLGGLAASGWHTCVAVMGLLEKTLDQHALILEPAGVEEVIWLKPVRPDDALTATLVSGPRSCDANGEQMGAFPFKVETVNQNGEPVMRWRMNCLVRTKIDVDSDPPFKAGECPMRRPRRARVTRQPGDHGIKFFEHVSAGDEIDLGDYEFSSENVRRFRGRYDGATPPAAARLAPLTASPWHVIAAWMQCIVRYYGHHAKILQCAGRPVPILGPAAGVKHLRWHRSVQAGETISFRAWAERKIEIAAHEDWGLLVVGAEGASKSGDIVVSLYPQMLLERASARNNTSMERERKWG